MQLRVALTATDRHRGITLVAVLGAGAAVALLLFGLPPIGVHAPWHYAGVMSPLCGGTRAARFTMTGDLGAAWAYNPLGILASLAALLVTSRAAVGWLTGRWLDVELRLARAGTVAVWAVVAVLVVALTVRQQSLAEMLMAAS